MVEIKKRWYTSLFFQLLIAVLAGVLIGHLWPTIGTQLKPVGDGFIRLIKMIIAPLIFCVVVTGIAAVGDLKSVGRLGFKAIVYFEVVTTFALLFGLLVANVFRPGAGLNMDPAIGGHGFQRERRQVAFGGIGDRAQDCKRNPLF